MTLATPSFSCLGGYTGASVSNLTAVASGLLLTFEASAGTTYQIAAVGSAREAVLQLALSNLRLVSPVDGLEFVTGDNIPLLAEVTATEEPVRKVEFFHDGISLGCVTNSPYGLVWSNAPGGTLSLTAIATDDQGHARTAHPNHERKHNCCWQ